MVLANGTTIENPTTSFPTSTPTPSPTPKPIEGKCLGSMTSPYFCKNLLMPDGSMVPNKAWVFECPSGMYQVENSNSCTYPQHVLDEAERQLQAQIQANEDENAQAVSDSGDDTSGDATSDTTDEAVPEKTYCDVPNPSNPCHDRKDYSDTTGLYTCIDGSHEEDWRDCTGGGASDNGDNDDNNNNDDNDDGDGREIEVDDVEDFEGGDSKETATGDREYDPEGDTICGNDETGEEWTC
jgi:hypothetical protein